MGNTPTNSDSSASQVTNQINGVARDLQALQTTQIFKDDTGTRRVLLGKGADGFYGLKVSQEGVDVFSAANDDLVFNSDQNVFKIVSSGTSIIDATSATAGVAISNTVAHNLGYIPAFQAYYSAGGFFYQLPNSTGWGASGGVMTFTNWIFAAVDDTNIYLYFIPSASGDIGLFPVKYYLLQETAN